MKHEFLRFLRSHILHLVLIAFLGFITYINTLWNGFISDDIVIIVENKLLSSPDSIWASPAASVRPLFYFILNKLWGLNPAPFHLLNIFFHVGTAMSLYILAYILTKKKHLSLVAACIFVVHPAISEGVAWISGGNYPQYGFFMTVTIILYILRKKYRSFMWLSVVFFIITLLSSQKAVVIPLVFWIYELCFGSVKKNWKDIIPFIVVSIVYSIFYYFKIGARIESLETDYYIEGGKFENPLLKIPFAITSYIQLLFFPARLTLYHSEVMGRTEYLVRIAGLAVFVAATIYSYIKNKPIFFWLMFFILNLLLVLTPLKVASTIAERYLYYASFGIILPVVMVAGMFTSKFKFNIIMAFAAGIIIVALMVRTVVRNFDWVDELTFWTQTAKTSPNAFSVRNNLGAALARINKDEEAVKEFNIALRLNPRYADAYKNLGFVYLKYNDADTALKYYEKALEYNNHNWQFYNDIGAAYIAKQDLPKAEEYFLKALSLSPGNELLYLNLGRIYMMQKENLKAKTAFEKVLNINPNNPLAAELLRQL